MGTNPESADLPPATDTAVATPQGELERPTMESLLQRANEQDAHAQIEVAKQYLKKAVESGNEDHNRTAVGWLIKAATEGKKDAANLLQQCVRLNKGICAENAEKACKLAQETDFERSLRKAARRMAASLNPRRRLQRSAAAAVTAATPPADSPSTSEPAESHADVPEGNGEKLRQHLAPSVCAAGRNAPVCASDDAGEVAEERKFDRQRKILRRFMSFQGMATGTKDLCTDDLLDMTKGYLSGAYARPPIPLVAAGVDEPEMDGPLDGSQPALLPSRDKLMQYPLQAVLEVKDYVVEMASKVGMQWLQAALPLNQINTIIFFFILSSLTIDFLGFIIPLIIFYLAFVSMVICTLRVVQLGKAWEEFRTWTNVVLEYEPCLDVAEAEAQFGWSHLEPYLHFLLSALFTVLSYPLAARAWLPCSELAVLSAVLAIAGYYTGTGQAGRVQTHARNALLAQVAISALQGLASLPAEAPLAWLLRPLGESHLTLPLALPSPSVAPSLAPSLRLNLGLPALLYALLVYSLYRVAAGARGGGGGGYRGACCALAPHVVCFVWWELSAELLSSGATALGLLRASVGYALFVFALPVLAIGLCAAAAFHCVRWLVALEFAKVGVTLALCAVPVLLRYWNRASAAQTPSPGHTSPVRLILFWLTTVAALSFLNATRLERTARPYNSPVSLEAYVAACGPDAWQQSSMAHTQYMCAHLEGHRVTWVGQLKQVRILETENALETFLGLLPLPVARWMRCVYGDKYPPCNSSERKLTASEERLCRTPLPARHPCHLKRLDRYKFELTLVTLGPGAADSQRDVYLRGGNEFRELLLRVPHGSKMEVSTRLEGPGLGARWPAFDLRAARCLGCSANEGWEEAQEEEEGGGGAGPALGRRFLKVEYDWWSTALSGVKFAFNFFFSPLLSVELD
uniref:Wolframin-like isoform X1 n=1 Tax=Petromyzon marinus TaxID=7757 RepID=A0AAJ7SYA8_PETMA|nr:wolframin-like isoform X1 [Petromyzon marinus]XP_032807883.1 wolframin-like isoform X1 [Petromyzon marinus]